MIVCRAHCVWDSFRYRKATTKKLCRERSCQNNRSNGDTEVAWRRAVSSNTPVLPRDPTLATTPPLRRSRGLLPTVSDRCTWEPKSQRNRTEAKEHSIIKQYQSHARAQQVHIIVPRGQMVLFMPDRGSQAKGETSGDKKPWMHRLFIRNTENTSEGMAKTVTNPSSLSW